MRRPLAIAVLLLALAAAPTANSVTIDATLRSSLHSPLLVSRKETQKSCQAGASKARVKLPGPSSVTSPERRSSTVACEQPPRSNLNIGGALKGAEAGAIAAAG